jgi:hypothetical protein
MRSEEQKALDMMKGINAEREIQPILSDFFNQKIIKDSWNNALIDFYNADKTIYIELKSRRMNWGDYPDMMIGRNKLDYFKAISKNADKSFYFCVNCSDGNYIAKLETDKEYRTYQKNVFVPCEDFVKI